MPETLILESQIEYLKLLEVVEGYCFRCDGPPASLPLVSKLLLGNDLPREAPASQALDNRTSLAKETETATKALSQVDEWMKEAGLVLHPEKTKVVDMGQPKADFEFLGCRFYRTSTGKIKRFVRQKSLKKMRERLKPLTRRSNGHSMEATIATINPILRGGYGYFKHICLEALDDIDGWVRERLRGILRHRQGRKGRVNQGSHFKWPNQTFHSLGLFCLKRAKQEEITNLQKKTRHSSC
jgi:RNA-directed DNA polymerase